MKQIPKCRVCGNTDLVEIVDLGKQALTGVFPRRNDPDPPVRPLKLVLCQGQENCNLLQLSHSCDVREMYGPEYGYRSATNPMMVKHLRAVVEQVSHWVSLEPRDVVLDIGCNDGTLLKSYGKCRKFGIDPSSERFREEFGEAELLVDFFSAEKVRDWLPAKPRVITSVAMFYDLHDPLGFMREIATTLADDGIWFSEQNYALDMVKNMAYDSICHEHLCYYNLRQILWMAEKCGLNVLDVGVNDVNGSSFWFIASKCQNPRHTQHVFCRNLEEEAYGLWQQAAFRPFIEEVEESKQRILRFFAATKAKGLKVFGYGASTKGNVLIQQCGLTTQEMPCIADRYDWKFGRVTPGSRIPIVSEKEARAGDPDFFFVFPWHFRKGIIERERTQLVFPLPTLEIICE